MRIKLVPASPHEVLLPTRASPAVARAQAQEKLEMTVAETVDAVQKAPKRAADKITTTVKSALASVQGNAQSQLDAARKEIEQRKK